MRYSVSGNAVLPIFKYPSTPGWVHIIVISSIYNCFIEYVFYSAIECIATTTVEFLLTCFLGKEGDRIDAAFYIVIVEDFNHYYMIFFK